MGFTINTNISSIQSGNQLNSINDISKKTMQKLSTALRINSASDDAAGLAIATRMSSQERTLATAVRNANDGISITQTAEGAMDEITGNLQRIRELAVQARSGQYGAEDINSMQQEVDARVAEINRISEQTRFNDQPVLDGTFNARIALSDDTGSTGVDVSVGDMSGGNLGAGGSRTLNEVTSSGTESLSANGAAGTLEIVDSAMSQVLSAKSQLGAVSNRFNSAISNLENTAESTAAARSRIMDADMATQAANNTKNMIMQQAGVAVHAQANTMSQHVLSLLS